jgi:hypothetical protein
MEKRMNSVELRSVHPHEAKEITTLPVWILTRLMVASVTVLMFLPFVAS